MDTVEISTAEKLEEYAVALDEALLFRGQTNHYATEQGEVSLRTSAYRRGSLPPLVEKWNYYADDILRVMTVEADPDRNDRAQVALGLLQHYGFRTSYIDLSSDFAVACWFAANRFVERPILEFAKDYVGNDVLLSRNSSEYMDYDGTGHLYAVSRHAAVDLGANCIDLPGSVTADFPTRYDRQRAWLAGPYAERMPPDCVVAHLLGPSDVFREVARRNGFLSTADVFPPRDEDWFYRLLLSVPWETTESQEGIRVYKRGLAIPEYDYTYIEQYYQNVAFFRRFRIHSEPLPGGTPLTSATFYVVPESAFYGQPPGGDAPLTHLTRKLREVLSVAIENDGLLKYPEQWHNSDYRKGLMMNLVEPNLVEISALCVSHPGTVQDRISVDMGWFYQIDSKSRWQHVTRPDQCPCNNPHRHQQLLWSAHIVEEMIARNAFKRASARVHVLR